MTIRISIGILAHNEEACIGATLRSLAQQSLFTDPARYSVEVVVVANGCRDRTVEQADGVLADLCAEVEAFRKVDARVVDVTEAGLANAWNVFLHELSDPDADHLVVMAADITFLDARTLQSMVDTLVADPSVHASVDRRIKDVAASGSRSLRDRLSVAVSGLSGGAQTDAGKPAWLSGQLSCLRGPVVRRIHFPTSMPTDDGYLYRMLVTDQLTVEEDSTRVVLAPHASHSFEAYTQPAKLIRHEQWLIFGDTIVGILERDLRQQMAETGQGCGDIVRTRNEQDSRWLNELVREHVALSGRRWFVPRDVLVRRFRSWRAKPLARRPVVAPLAVAAAAVDAWCAWRVNRRLLTDAGGFRSGGWGKNP